jgi:hypothetical protein
MALPPLREHIRSGWLSGTTVPVGAAQLLPEQLLLLDQARLAQLQRVLVDVDLESERERARARESE